MMIRHFKSFYLFLFVVRGYGVEEAREGKEAVAAIEKRAPDLVVLDIVMPVMGGYTVVHYIKFDAFANSCCYFSGGHDNSRIRKCAWC
ncbi:MAG: response regulator [Candidatus Omnitrophica bacterium]|nr:response regulator [Candidatus Omnitrophota bacterium]